MSIYTMEGVELCDTSINLRNTLKEHGLVCRREKSDQYYFIYKTPEGYDESFLCESEIDELLSDKSYLSKTEINDFISFVNESLSSFLNKPMLYKVDKLIKHFGSDTIMGKSVSPLTLTEALYILDNE